MLCGHVLTCDLGILLLKKKKEKRNPKCLFPYIQVSIYVNANDFPKNLIVTECNSSSRFLGEALYFVANQDMALHFLKTFPLKDKLSTPSSINWGRGREIKKNVRVASRMESIFSQVGRNRENSLFCMGNFS